VFFMFNVFFLTFVFAPVRKLYHSTFHRDERECKYHIVYSKVIEEHKLDLELNIN